MVDTQHFCLRWNNYQSSITSAFENLRDDEDFVDVTLACDGKSLKAHRVVLSACSPYFRELLKSTPCKHPVIVLQDVAFTDLHALVEFIYHGEVNVHQRSLSSFLKTAEVLRVSGLTQHDDGQGPLAQVQSLAARAAAAAASSASPTPPHPPHTPHTPHAPHAPHVPPMVPSYCDKLEEALLSHSTPPTVQQLLRRAQPPLQSHRRLSRSSDNSPDVIKRPRHDNNNTEHPSHNTTPQITAADFSTKNNSLLHNSRINHQQDPAGNNGNGVSNSSSSPSPRLMEDVKHEPLELLYGQTADIDRSNDSPPHIMHHRQHMYPQMGPPSRGSSAEADDRTPPPLPPPPFLSPNETKLFTAGGTFNFSMAALADHSPLAGLGGQGMTSDGMAGTSQGKKLFTCHLCGKVLCSKASLKRHIADKHAERQEEYRCAICERIYCSRNSLMTHIYTYHKSRPGELDIKFF